MDQFSHDLTVALEETSLLDRARVSRWTRRRTRSTGNLPSAPQPTEDSSSSPTDQMAKQCTTQLLTANVDGLPPLASSSVVLHSDSDEKQETLLLRLPCKSLNSALRLGTLESDSLNENFSPSRFFKSSARKKRKFKRMSVEYEAAAATAAAACAAPSTVSTTAAIAAVQSTNPADAATNTTAAGVSGLNSMRKRLLKPDMSARSNLFFCGKRKRSNRDRYNEHDLVKLHFASAPRHSYLECNMRPRSFSSTCKPHSERLLPLNKGLLSKIEKISKQQKTDETDNSMLEAEDAEAEPATATAELATVASSLTSLADQTNVNVLATTELQQQPQECKILEQTIAALPCEQTDAFQAHRKKPSRRRTAMQQQLQFVVDQHPMDCTELNDVLSSSSLSSSESDDSHTANDTDREGDDELTDWPGNEAISGPTDLKFDAAKRKLTKKNNLSQYKIDENISAMISEDDTLMSISGALDAYELRESLELRYAPSEPINIATPAGSIGGGSGSSSHNMHHIPLKQIESEMSGETSNPFLSSPPCQPTEVREIRAGCRRINGERAAFSVKTSVNERLARFLQDPRQVQIRLPDLEIYEHDSLLNLATLYSLHMSLDNGCAVLSKTSNTTQSVNIEQQSLQSRLLLSDFKRRCYDSDKSCTHPHK